MAAAAAISLVGCEETNSVDIVISVGSNNTTTAYVLCEGTMGYNIEGALSTINFKDFTSTPDAFKDANKRSLGDTPQCGIVYGDHIFIGVCESNVIEVLDRATLRSVKQIPLANRQGQKPRSMVAKDGSVYVSMYNGYVCRMDTVSLEINAILPVGPNPEIMAIVGDYLYVPNSDGMNWEVGYGTTATRIDLSNFTVERNFTVGLNPYKFIAGDNGDLFLICRGNYADIAAQIYKVDPITLKSIALGKANYAAYYERKIYAIYAPWGEEAAYTMIDLSTGDVTSMPENVKVDSPTAIAVCPLNGYIFVASNTLDNGFAAYDRPGYCSVFDINGESKGKYATSVNPTQIFF